MEGRVDRFKQFYNTTLQSPTQNRVWYPKNRGLSQTGVEAEMYRRKWLFWFMKLQWLSNKWVKVLLHVLVWVLLFSLPSLLRPAQNQSMQPQHEKSYMPFVYQYLVNCVSWVCLFYTNSYLLIPHLINRKKYIQYFISLLPVLAGLALMNWLSSKLFLPGRDYSFLGLLFFFLLPCVFFLACSIAFTMIGDRIRSDSKAKERETENLKTEMAFLRSQVSPHFMFNVLNNMVMLARKGSDQLEPSLFKLSSLMRYMLYETDENKVLLDREIEYIQSYTDLQIQRFGSKVKVNLLLENQDKTALVEPMLLIPFVENAFKHGTGWKKHAEINIELIVKDDLLNFMVSNYYDSSKEQVKDETSGIGLQNVKRRLDLLYKKQHVLQITDQNNCFTVSLQLNLH